MGINNKKLKLFNVVMLIIFMSNSVFSQETLLFTVSQFIIEGKNPISSSETQSVLNKYTGEQSGLEGLNAARDELEQLLSKRGFPFYQVTLPAQELLNGSVIFKILQFKLGQIHVEGNQAFSNENILNSMPTLELEKSPNTQEVSRSLALANESPAKNVALRFKAGDGSERIDALLTVTEVSPTIYYMQLNNSGADDNSYRLSLGYQNNALWGKDHGMGISYTTSPEDTSSIKQWGLSYRLPLYKHGAILNFIVSDSSVDSGTVAEVFEVSGSGQVVGVNYKRSLIRSGNYTHDFNIGLALKTFDNDVSFSGSQVGSEVKTQSLTIDYNAQLISDKSQWSFNIGGTMNISGGDKNEDKDYEAFRGDDQAGAKWSSIHYSINYKHYYQNQSLLSFRFKGLESSDLLVSGEQFGIGGFQTVRGYEERSVSGDSGQALSVEYWFKPWSFTAAKTFVFLDAGSATLNSGEFEGSSQNISSIGLGLRYLWGKSISVNLDVAQAFEETAITDDGDVKAHLSLFVRF